MMAEKIFDRYIDNADAVMDLSYSMLEKHIADQEDTSDYTEDIKRKESEIERLSKKRVNLIEMRAEGDIDKELSENASRKLKIELPYSQMKLKPFSLMKQSKVRKTICRNSKS